MPALSLVVCLHNERILLERLLRQNAGLCDDLVVVHDGPIDSEQQKRFEELVAQRGGRFFVRARAFQQEPHWPFAWGEAKHDWILRLDADENLSTDLKKWIEEFRAAREPEPAISGYTCIWPLWNGKRMVTTRWPAGRIFLINRQRVRFFGMAEQVPVPDGRFEPVPLILEHRPDRKSYGIANLILRQQAFEWRRIIAKSLLGKPADLPVWRWSDEGWPDVWEEIRRKPIRTAFYRLLIWPLRGMRDYWRHEHKLLPSAAISGGIHHCLIALRYWWMRHFGK